MNNELTHMFEYMASEYMGYNPILSESQVVTMLGEDSGVATVIVKVNELGKQAYNVIFSVAIVSAEKGYTMKDKFKPYTKDLQLESWWYILKYDDGDIVYAWYDSDTN